MDLTVVTYLTYLAIAVPLTIWVAHTLSRNGRTFLIDVFEGKGQLADAVNRLLVVGFYLLNIGFVALYLRVGDSVISLRQMVETLSVKLGVVMLALGVIHLFNFWVFSRMRRRHQMESMRTPPVPPQFAAPWPPVPPVPQQSSPQQRSPHQPSAQAPRW